MFAYRVFLRVSERSYSRLVHQVLLFFAFHTNTKHNGKVWLSRKTQYDQENGGFQAVHNSCLYFRLTGKTCIYIVVYLDDKVMTCEDE